MVGLRSLGGIGSLWRVEVFVPPMLCSFILKGVGKAIGSISYVSVHRAFTAMML